MCNKRAVDENKSPIKIYYLKGRVATQDAGDIFFLAIRWGG